MPRPGRALPKERQEDEKTHPRAFTAGLLSDTATAGLQVLEHGGNRYARQYLPPLPRTGNPRSRFSTARKTENRSSPAPRERGRSCSCGVSAVPGRWHGHLLPPDPTGTAPGISSHRRSTINTLQGTVSQPAPLSNLQTLQKGKKITLEEAAKQTIRNSLVEKRQRAGMPPFDISYKDYFQPKASCPSERGDRSLLTHEGTRVAPETAE